MSFAIAVKIPGSAVRSIAGHVVPTAADARKSATTSIASVAEPPFPSASSLPPRAKLARSAIAARCSALRLSVSVWARCARIVDATSVAAGEQTATIEEHVHQLPKNVVERLDELLADVTIFARGLELPLGGEL